MARRTSSATGAPVFSDNFRSFAICSSFRKRAVRFMTIQYHIGIHRASSIASLLIFAFHLPLFISIVMEISPLLWATILTTIFEFLLVLGLWFGYRNSTCIYFNPEDNPNAPPATAAKASKDAKFDPFISQYTGLAKVMIALAAASISFGGLNTNQVYIFAAKLLLAYSIATALAFCILVTLYYENYLHDVTSYAPVKCALTESLGLTSVVCFIAGYVYWAWHL